MFALAKKMKKDPETETKSGNTSDDNTNNNHNDKSQPAHPPKKFTVRDRLLQKEVLELKETLPKQCQLKWDDANAQHDFHVTIKPDEGHWKNGSFQFHVAVPEMYNMMPPKIKCTTKIWHPNITEEGAVCLSILRQSSIDEQGWAPTRSLKDAIWGVNSLFTDLLNFDDPLNGAAAKEFKETPEVFKKKVRTYIEMYCVSGGYQRVEHDDEDEIEDEEDDDYD